MTFCGKMHFAALLYLFPPSHTQVNRTPPPTTSTTTTATITTTAPAKTKKTEEGESKIKQI